MVIKVLPIVFVVLFFARRAKKEQQKEGKVPLRYPHAGHRVSPVIEKPPRDLLDSLSVAEPYIKPIVPHTATFREPD